MYKRQAQDSSKKVGLIGLVGIVISAMIGGGIYNLPQNMAADASAGAIIIALSLIHISARTKAAAAVNDAMVSAYWEIGRQIVEAQGDRAEYGQHLMEYLSERLTAEFGKGFTERNLRAMRQLYLAYPIRHTLCAELSWSHYRLIIRIDDPCLLYTSRCV